MADSLGQRLRSRREAQGIRLEDVAAATKIGKRFLEALEADDYASLPDDVFAKGFVRAFAQHIGAEPEEMVDAWERQRSGEGVAPVKDDNEVIREMSRLLDDPQDGAEPAGRRATLIWLVVGAAVVTVAAWLVMRSTDSSLPAEEPEPATPAAVVQREPVEPRVLPAAAPVQEEPQAEIVAEVIPAETATEVVGDDPAPLAEPEPEPPQALESTPEPVEIPPPAPQPETVSPTRLEVVEHAVGTEVRDRRIVGAGDRFEAGDRVSFWTRVVGGEAGDVIRHVWLHEGRVVQTIELELGASHWRTHSRKTLWYTGRWSVEVQDAAGRALARSEFVAE